MATPFDRPWLHKQRKIVRNADRAFDLDAGPDVCQISDDAIDCRSETERDRATLEGAHALLLASVLHNEA